MIHTLRFNNINKLLLAGVLLLVSVLLLQTATAPKASAAYDGNRIIDNTVFLDATSMSQATVQNFLDGKGGEISRKWFIMDCDLAGAQAKQVYVSLGAPCGSAVKASHIIYYVAQVYGVSPKVIIATMQKEQSLITATNPIGRQYDQAMGYGCPTSGNCTDGSSFFWQVDNGTWALRFHYERARGNSSWWYQNSGWVCGTEKAYYKPNLYPNQNVNFYDEDGTYYRTHYIANAATSAMYCYTPHAYNNPQGLYGRAPYGTTGRYYSGSYNFVLFYEAWFGATQGWPFQWQVLANNFYDSTKSISIDPSKLKGGERVKVSLKVRNTGTEIWYKNGPNPVMLGTTRPDNRQSAVCDQTWLSCSRVARPLEEVIAPGGEGHFEFTITVPSNPGELREYFAPVLENRSWMTNDTGYHIYLRTTGQYAWEWGSFSAWNDPGRTQPTNLTALARGQYFYVTLYAKNTGGLTWSKSGPNPVTLGTSNPLNNHSVICTYAWINCTRAVVMNESQVAPGQTGSFTFLARAPYNFGDHREYLKPVSEFNAWMSDNPNHIYMKVTQ